MNEIKFRVSRSQGPGGQHVNKTSSRVELIFDVKHSLTLNDYHRQRLLTKLKSYIDKEGLLHLVCDTHRSQKLNKEAVVKRFIDLIKEGLKVPKVRRATKPTKASRKRRLDSKKRHSDLKRSRSHKDWH